MTWFFIIFGLVMAALFALMLRQMRKSTPSQGAAPWLSATWRVIVSSRPVRGFKWFGKLSLGRKAQATTTSGSDNLVPARRNKKPKSKEGWSAKRVIAVPALIFVPPALICIAWTLQAASLQDLGLGIGGLLGLWILFRWIYVPGMIEIPEVHFGIIRRFKKRLSTILKEGPHWIIPYIDKVEVFEQNLVNKTLNARAGEMVKVISKDKLAIEVTGALQYRSSYEVADAKGRNRYAEMDDSVIEGGISDAVEKQLGEIAGVMVGSDFIRNREALDLLAECTLRLDHLPHEHAKVYDSSYPQDVVPAGERIGFYQKHATKIKEKVRTSAAAEFSTIEERYGIEIISFNLTSVSFDEATTKVQESEAQGEMFDKLVKKFEAMNAKDPVAAALAFAGKASFATTNFLGLEAAGVVPAAAAQFLSRNPAGSTPTGNP